MKWAAFVFTTVPLLIQFYAKRYEEQDNARTLAELEEQHGVPQIRTYDYIIAGAGTAGSLLAGRLFERFNVLLLEAGGSPVPMTQTPYYTYMVATDPQTNYFFKSTPQASAALKDDGIISFHLGKMLGGSGSHNDMVYMRGNPRDWDTFSQIVGDEGYNYANIVPHYKRTENFVGELVNPEESEYYGIGGPMGITTDLSPITVPWFAAGEELGYVSADPNAFQRKSFAPIQAQMSRGQRVSTYNSYVKPFESTRQNLTVIRYAYVNEVLIDEAMKAYGVSYTRHGIPQVAHASREVIVSSGTFSSPLLLMRSGVGPKDILEEAGIPVKVEVPELGKNLADHVFFTMGKMRLNASGEPYVVRVLENNFEQMLKTYETSGEGILGIPQEGPQALFVSSRAIADGQSDWPDSRVVLSTQCTSPFEENAPIEICLYMFLDRAKSRGSLRLNTTEYKGGSMDDTKLAVVDLNMMSDPSDVDVLVEAIEETLRIFEQTERFKAMGANFPTEKVPECSQHVFRSRVYWECFVKNYGGSGLHMTGTCSMGSVVDKELKVKGVSNLRVVDASVFPATPNSNLNAPVVAIAEKTAYDILASNFAGDKCIM